MVSQDLALVEAQDISTNLNIGQDSLPEACSDGWGSSTARRSATSEAELDGLGSAPPR